MPSVKFATIDEYLAAQPENVRALLIQVHDAIIRAVPDAVERIAYHMPTYDIPGGTVLHVAGWKRHFALYPMSDAMITHFGEDLAPFDLSHKGTIRFPLTELVPVTLIGEIAAFRAAEVRAKVAANEG